MSVADGPIESLKTAIRGVLIEDATLAARPIASGELKANAPLPAARINVHSDVPTKVLGPSDAYRTYVVSLEWCAVDAGGVAATTLASRLNELTRSRLVETMSFTVGEGEEAIEYVDEPADVRINRYLHPQGYDVMIPLEEGAILPYAEYVGKDRDVKRWCVGYWYHLRTQKL